jgi:predicted  nucleic acid-binding Zn-ribbon protein
MTTVRQMFALQELDIILDRVQKEHDKAEHELNSGNLVKNLETELEHDAEKLQETELQQRATKLEADSQKERSETLNSQLYGGEVTNPRDLESLEREASNVLQLVEQQESALAEFTVKIEAAQTKKSELESQLDEAKAAWKVRQAELQGSLKELKLEKAGFEGQRSKLTDTLDPTSMQRYDVLRKSKGGLAVARVERGLCQGCKMSLPTHQQQRVRSGSQVVLCSSCGRMLFLGT